MREGNEKEAHALSETDAHINNQAFADTDQIFDAWVA